MPPLTRDDFDRRLALWRRRSHRVAIGNALGFLAALLAWFALPRWLGGLGLELPPVAGRAYGLLFAVGLCAWLRLYLRSVNRAWIRAGLACPSCAGPLPARDYGATVRRTGTCPACGAPALAG